MPLIGWDIGGVNTKVARVVDGTLVAAHTHPFELQRDPQALAPLLASLADRVGASSDDHHAVTMTAELSQMFRTKRDGVAFVLDAVCSAFRPDTVHVYTTDGRFLSPDHARREPLAVAASNWAATAHLVALTHPNAILVDIGTTTTDIIPIADGQVVARGTTDPARLASRELVYSGALRTPAEAIVQTVPLDDGDAVVSAESFALIGDVHVWRGHLAPDDYSVPTPDGRPPTREFAGERLARTVCADREMLDGHAVSRIADAIAAAQVAQIADAIARVHARHPALSTAVTTGLGAFIADRAARSAGLHVVPLAESLGVDGARGAPAAAVALLLDGQLSRRALGHHVTSSEPPNVLTRTVDVVMKVGGGLLAHGPALYDVLRHIVDDARDSRIAIVPGGGPFADAVRDADRQHALDDDTAHWMAVLAMDQYAHLLAARHPGLTLAETREDVESALASGAVPVIAPSRWLRGADPLPHSWDVTSDSISAWFAGILGATRLILVKPPGASGLSVVDAYFATALPPGVSWSAEPLCHPEQSEATAHALRSASDEGRDLLSGSGG